MAPIDATRLSILGFGTVGQALAERLTQHPGLRVVSITDRSGTVESARGVDVQRLAAAKRAGGIGGDPARDASWVVEHVDADIVVDLLPTDLRTAEPSLGLALSALRRGRHVVTAAKGSLALHGPRLAMAAREADRELLASATVCGGTPVLELLRGAFRGDCIERIDAVLNGSTNFVLSRIERGAALDEALREARKRGILEEDPSLDLLGLDAAAKAVILANEAWSIGATLADARTEGILSVRPDEVRHAAAQGMAVRLVARASPQRGIAVAPVTLPRDHPLVVDGTENVVRVTLAGAGEITIRGPGAGGRETASAVLNDILALAPRRHAPPSRRPIDLPVA